LYIILVLVWQGWVVATGDIGRTVSDVLRIPQLPFRLLVPVSGALLFLEFIVDLLINAEKLFKKQVLTEGSEEKNA